MDDLDIIDIIDAKTGSKHRAMDVDLTSTTQQDELITTKMSET